MLDPAARKRLDNQSPELAWLRLTVMFVQAMLDSPDQVEQEMQNRGLKSDPDLILPTLQEHYSLEAILNALVESAPPNLDLSEIVDLDPMQVVRLVLDLLEPT